MSVKDDSVTGNPFGFYYTRKALRNTTIYEKLLLDANYNWVIHNKLEHNGVLDEQVSQSKTTFLIVKGRVQFRRISYAWSGRKVQTLFANGIGRKQLVVRAGGEYEITAYKEGGTEFAEGHLCLQPELAIRLLKRGVVRWYGKGGGHVSRKSIIPTLQHTEMEYSKGKHIITVRNAHKDPNAALIKEWFDTEWSEYANRKAVCEVVDYGDVYTRGDGSGKAQALAKLLQAEANEIAPTSDESDSSANDELEENDVDEDSDVDTD